MLEPIMRLIHLSDVHFGDGVMGPVQRRLAAYAFGPWLGTHARKFEAGLSSHDVKALPPLRRSIEALKDDITFGNKTQLVVTGDLSTWGDRKSIRGVLKLVRAIARATNLPDPIVLYGNHDVWPGKVGQWAGLPIASSNAALDTNRSDLRSQVFPQDYSREVAAYPFAGGTRRLCMWELNSVLHGRLENFLARGEVRRDRYWEVSSSACQLAKLSASVSSSDIVVALMHHPIHNSDVSDAIIDQRKVAQTFNSTSSSRANPLVQVVLSGHTHETTPQHGKLPRARPSCSPLGNQQIQLTVGTVSQAPFASMPEHHWQLLDFYYDGKAQELAIQRVLYQWDGFGEFEPDLDAAGHPMAEVVRLRCS